jgi:hypothetical protein
MVLKNVCGFNYSNIKVFYVSFTSIKMFIEVKNTIVYENVLIGNIPHLHNQRNDECLNMIAGLQNMHMLIRRLNTKLKKWTDNTQRKNCVNIGHFDCIESRSFFMLCHRHGVACCAKVCRIQGHIQYIIHYYKYMYKFCIVLVLYIRFYSSSMNFWLQ